jgi:hypothetical protein
MVAVGIVRAVCGREMKLFHNILDNQFEQQTKRGVQQELPLGRQVDRVREHKVEKRSVDKDQETHVRDIGRRVHINGVAVGEGTRSIS